MHIKTATAIPNRWK